MSKLFKRVIRAGFENPNLKPAIVKALKEAAATNAVPEWAEGQKFKNPQTGNDVLFSSLPKETQSKLREQHSKGSEKEDSSEDKSKGKDDDTDEGKDTSSSDDKKAPKMSMTDIALDTAKVLAVGAVLKMAAKPVTNIVMNKFKDFETQNDIKTTVSNTAKILGTATWKNASKGEKKKFAGEFASTMAKGVAMSAAKATKAVVEAGGLTGYAAEKASGTTKGAISNSFKKVSDLMYEGNSGVKTSKTGKYAVKAATFVVGAAAAAAVVWGVKKLMAKHTQKVDKKINEVADKIKAPIDKVKKPIDNAIKKQLDIKTEEEGGIKKMVLAAENTPFSGKDFSSSMTKFMTDFTPEKMEFAKSVVDEDGKLDPKKLKKMIVDFMVP